MLNMMEENSLTLQQYADQRDEISSFEQLISEGLTIKHLPESSQMFDLQSASIESIKFTKNMSVWNVAHFSPQQDCSSNFKFVHPAASFGYLIQEENVTMEFDMATNTQVVQFKSLKTERSRELFQRVFNFIKNQKIMIYVVYKSLESFLQIEQTSQQLEHQLMQGIMYTGNTSKPPVRRLRVISLTYHQILIEDTVDKSTMKFVLTYDNNNPVKVMLTPAISQLNQLIAIHITKSVKQFIDQNKRVYEIKNETFDALTSFMRSVMEVKHHYQQIIELQFQTASMQSGHEPVSFSFSYSYSPDQSEFINDEINTSLHARPLYKELFMIINYRSCFLLLIRVNQSNILFMDYTKTLNFFESEQQQAPIHPSNRFYDIPHSDKLDQLLQLLANGVIKQGLKLTKNALKDLDQSNYLCTIPVQNGNENLKTLVRSLFDYLGCVYLLQKINPDVLHSTDQNREPFELWMGSSNNSYLRFLCQPIVAQNQQHQKLEIKLQLELKIDSSHADLEKSLRNYFDAYISNCYKNYAILRGFYQLMNSDQHWQPLRIYELFHLQQQGEMLNARDFLQHISQKQLFVATSHSQQQIYDREMSKRRLRIYVMLDQIDPSLTVSIRFIDPQTLKYKLIRFFFENISSTQNQTANYYPYERDTIERIKNDYAFLCSCIQSNEFKNLDAYARVLRLATFELKDLYNQQ